jgi:hypothetical protein
LNNFKLPFKTNLITIETNPRSDPLAFCKVIKSNAIETECFWGLAPKPPWFRFAEGLGLRTFCEAEQSFLCISFGKRRTLMKRVVSLKEVSAFLRQIFVFYG